MLSTTIATKARSDSISKSLKKCLELLLHWLTETEWLQLHLCEICTRIQIKIKLKLQEEERKGD
jgi:hypothetical protein